MIFAFDMDETLTMGDMVAESSKEMLDEGKLDKVYTSADIRSWNMKPLPQELIDRIVVNFKDPEKAVWSRKIIQGVYYFISTIKATGHFAYVITSRPSSLQKETRKYLSYHFKDMIDNVFFTNPSDDVPKDDPPTKIDALKLVGPDVYFDDNLEYCKQALSLNIDTYLITNKRTPWNHKDIPENLKTLKCLSHFDPHNYWELL